MTSNKKTILIFIDWYEPGYKAGGPIRSVVNLVSHLKSHYNFKIITRNTDYTETTGYKDITPNEWIRIDQSTQLYYISPENLKRSTIKKLIRETSFDFKYLNSLFSFYFSLLPLFLDRGKTVLAVRGMLSDGALGVKSIKKKMFLRTSKVCGLFKNVIFQATTEEEKKQINNHFPSHEVVVASNLSQSIIYSEFKEFIHKSSEGINLFFLGRIAPEKNTHYAIEIINKITDKEISLDIYGAVYDKAYFKKCTSLIEKSPSNVTVNYKGIITPQQIPETLKSYHALLFPSTGENFGHAIIESLLNAKPVIISDQTPWKQNKSTFVHSLDSMDQFVNSVNHMAGMSNNEYQVLAENALQFGNECSASKEVIKSYLHIFDTI